MISPPAPWIRAVQRALAATARGPGAAAWQLAYRALAQAAALRETQHGVTVYARGSLAGDRPAPALSDIDLVVVVDAHPPPRLREGRVVHRTAYSQAELDDALQGPAPTYGLGHGSALFHRRDALDDPLWLRARPGLAGPGADWRRLRGPERRRPRSPSDAQAARVNLWLELQWWWRHAISACAGGPAPHHTRLGAKLVAEGARGILILDGEDATPMPRHVVLERAREAIGEEEPAIRAALNDLDRLGPADLADPLATFARMCGRIAARLAQLAPPAVAVPLVGERTHSDVVPLADWRAVVAADPPEQRFTLMTGRPGHPRDVAAAAAAGPLTALRERNLLLFAAPDVWPATVFRTLACPVTDPASFALLDGAPDARFPEARGWSSRDWAARAVAEQRARLADPPADDAGAIGVALSAGRAALLAEGELALTPHAAAERLGWTEAAGWWSDRVGTPPGLVSATLAAARALPAYTSRR